ncbi:MAG: sigma-54 dependent transcriptional regulator [Gemmatimonadales bacterium]
MPTRVLVVDDDQGVRQALRQLLEFEGHTVKAVASGREALDLYPTYRPHLMFLDVKMAGLDGLETLTRLRAMDPHAVVIMISGHGTIQTAVEATQRGAWDFLEKPLDTDRLLVTVRNALEHVTLEAEHSRLKARIEDRYAMVGTSKAIRDVLAMVEKVAPMPTRVLITGENGSGKELVARAIHRQSPRAAGPFVAVNCAAIPTELIESELFGHMKGSFTGAISDRAGKFEQADAGTLFLDEVGDMSLAAQAKVLRVLQEGQVTRIGSTKPVPVDVRVIAASNKNLEAEIAAARFRDDLFYRLNVVPIGVPPLRHRREDIPLLVERFITELAQFDGIAPRRFTPDALDVLKAHEWPGNVRELRNTVERLLIMANGDITGADVTGLRAGHAASPLGDLMHAETFEAFKHDAEKAFLEAKLAENDWNVSETARKLSMPRSNLYKKLEKYGLSREGSDS